MESALESELHKRVLKLEDQVEQLLARNRRVDAHKSWETSKVRLVSISVVTYITMILVFSVLGSARPVLDAFVPTTGFVLSTLSLSFVRRVWERFVNRCL